MPRKNSGSKSDQLAALITQLRSGNEATQLRACKALVGKPNAVAAIPPLRDLLDSQSCSDELVAAALHVLVNIAGTAEGGDKLVSAGLVPCALAVLARCLQQQQQQQQQQGDSALAEAATSAAAMLANLAADPRNHAQMIAAQAVPALGKLAVHGTAQGQDHACGALTNLVNSPEGKAAVASAGALPHLVHHLAHGPTNDAKMRSAIVLRNLVSGSPTHQVAVVASGALPGLVALLGSGSAKVQEQAAGVLTILANTSANVPAIVAAGAIPALAGVLRSPGHGNVAEVESLRGEAAAAIQNLCIEPFDRPDLSRAQLVGLDPKNKVLAVQAGAVPPLVGLLSARDAQARMRALRCLAAMLRCGEGGDAVVAAGGVKALAALLKPPAPKGDKRHGGGKGGGSKCGGGGGGGIAADPQQQYIAAVLLQQLAAGSRTAAEQVAASGVADHPLMTQLSAGSSCVIA